MNEGEDLEQNPNLGPEFFEGLKTPLLPKIAELQQRFEYEAKSVSSDEIEAHCGFAQRDLLPLMMRAPFFHRSYTKPLGYAGDYEMVNMMITGVREGPTTYAQLVNDFYLEIGLVKAHRNRLLILQQRLSERARLAEENNTRLKVLNVGCGPSIELERFIKEDPLCERCDFRLIDFNEETLNYARDRLAEAMRVSGRRPNLEFVQQSVHGLLKQSVSEPGAQDESFDFVYCAGLFDYISDRICQRLLGLFCRWVNPGGLVLATNVHPDNPTRWIMEHVVDWHLIHRTMQDMLAIAPPDHPTRIYDDDTHLNVFLEIPI
jgi:extracellular factor (EF) 3-hydroxypalmitic acid methyl ester biosynthesis protein